MHAKQDSQSFRVSVGNGEGSSIGFGHNILRFELVLTATNALDEQKALSSSARVIRPPEPSGWP
jgi:hypothetical protein